MMGRWNGVRALLTGALAMTITTAAAHEARADDLADPDDPEVQLAEPYSRELWARPLTLPGGMIEGSAWLWFEHYHDDDITYTEQQLVPGVRAAVGKTELSASVAIHAGVDDSSDPPLGEFSAVQRVDLAARYGLWPSGYVGLELGMVTPGSDFHGFMPGASIRYKVRSSTRVAGVLGTTMGLQLYDDDRDGASYDFFFADFDVRGQMRASSRIGIEVGLLGPFRRRENYVDDIGRTIQYMSIEARAVVIASITKALDLQVLGSTESLGTKVLAFNLAVRGGA